jgi:hypothetical protein
LLDCGPATGTGDVAVTGYSGGKCKGSKFDSTGATVAYSATVHFVVTNGGNRVDSLVTSLSDPANGFGGFSLSEITLRSL